MFGRFGAALKRAEDLAFHADMGVISLALIDLVRGRSAIPFPFFFRFLARIVGLQVLPR